MRKALPDHGLPGYRNHIGQVRTTDAKDRHVAAVAVTRSPSFLLTWNGDDFHVAELQGLGGRVNPDAFLTKLFATKPELVHGGIMKAYGFVRSDHGKTWSGAPSWLDHLHVLATRGAPNALPGLASRLRSFGRVPKDLDDELTGFTTGLDEPENGGARIGARAVSYPWGSDKAKLGLIQTRLRAIDPAGLDHQCGERCAADRGRFE